MNLKVIINELKLQYQEHEDLEDMLNDLSANDYIDHWASKLCEDEFNNNTNLARNLFEIQETKCDDADSFISLAETVADDEKLNDKDWAKKLLDSAYSKVESLDELKSLANAYLNILDDKNKAITLYKATQEKLAELADYNSLIEDINNELQDKKWAEDIINSAVDNLKNADDMFEFAGYSSTITQLGQFIGGEDYLNNKEKAKEIFDMVLLYEGITDLLDGARAVKETYENSDANYYQEYTSKALEKATSFLDDGYYCDLYNFIKDDLEDEDKAKQFKDTYIDEMINDHEQYEGCEELFGTSEDEDIDFDDFDDRKNIVAFSMTYILNDVQELIDEDGKYTDKAYQFMQEKINEFTADLKYKFEDNVLEDIYLSSRNTKLYKYNGDLQDCCKDIDWEMNLYLCFTKEIPSDTMDKLFLDMDNYGFYAYFKDWDSNNVVTQGYDYGEYNTGYFSEGPDDCYINTLDKNYTEVEKEFGLLE